MVTYEIQGPDGKTYSIDGPEGASREEVIAAIQARMQTPPSAPAPIAEARKAVPVGGTYGFMGEGIDDTTAIDTDISQSVMRGVKTAPVTTASKAPLRPEVRAALENKYNEATPKERKKLTTVPGAVGDVFRQQAQEDERAKNLPEATQRLNPRAEFDATRVVEPSDTTEFVKGVTSGVSALKSMWEGAGIAKDVGVATQALKSLDLYDQIDRGVLDRSNLTPAVAGGDMSPQFRDAQLYLAADEKKRQQLRERATSEIQNRKDFVAAAVKTIQQYQEENKKNKGRTENLTDVEGATDFANWLSFNMGSGAVQMAPVMLAAIATGGPGAYLMGTGMELGGATQNRLEFILNKTKSEKNPEKRAKAIFDYVQKTNDTSLAQAISSGAVDVLLGPVADVIKTPLRQAIREKTRREIAKQIPKAVARQTGEEAIAGGTQEIIAIAAERALEEQTGIALTKENIKRVVDAAAAEAVGGGGVSAATGAARVALGPRAERTAPRAEPTVEPAATAATPPPAPAATPAAPAPAATAAPTDPRKEALVRSYIEQGFMPDDADLLATQALGGLEPTPPAAPTVAPAVAEEAPAFLPKELAGAKPRYAFGNKLFELNFESDIDRAAYIAAQSTPSKRDADYVNFVARATGMSEPEVRAHGRAVRDSIKAQARASETGGRLEVAEVARARKPVAPPAVPAGVPPLELPITDAEGRAIQRRSAEDEARTMAGRAERAALQMEGDNVPTTEPPPFVTEPSTDERGIPVPSAEAGAAELPTTPIDRGLGAASSAARQLAGREELERAALVEQQELAERAISRGFAREPYPDLGLTLGASWVRDTLATNPTPEQYQEAAYARLEELGGLPPRDARPAFERLAPAAPMVGERPEAGVERPAKAAPAEAVEAPPAAKAAESKRESNEIRTNHTVYNPETGEEGVLTIFRTKDNPDEVTGVRIRGAGYDTRIGTTFSKQGPISDEKVLENFIFIDVITTEKPRGPKPVKPTALPEAKPGEAAMPIQRGSVAAIPMSLLTTPEALQRAGEVLAVPDKTPERIRRELSIAAQRGGLAEWEVRKIIGEEEPRGPEAPKAVKAKEKRPAQPAAPAAPAVTEKPTKEAVQTHINTIKRGDSLVDSLDGTEFLVDDVIKNKSGNITAVVYSYVDDNGNTKYATLDFDAIASILTPQTYTDTKTGERKISEPGRIKRAEPAAPATPLELEAGRKEELEVDPSILDTVARTSPEKLKQQLIAEFGATAAGEPRKRAPGGGREVSGIAKTGAERVEQAADVINLTRDTLAEISAVRKLERSTTGDFFGIAARTAEEKAYREALRDLSIETLRAELYKKAQKFKSRPIVAYAQAGKYIKSLKPAEQERAKALAEKREDYTTLPPLPTTLSSPAQRKKAIEKIRAAEEEVVAEPVKEARPAKEVVATAKKETEFFTTAEAEPYRKRGEEARRRAEEKGPQEKTRWTDYNAQLLARAIPKSETMEAQFTEEEIADAIEDIADGTFDAKDAKKMTFDDLIALTQAAMELAAEQHTQDTDKTFAQLDTLAGALAYIAQKGTPLDAGMAEALLTGENGELIKNVSLHAVKPLREGQEPTDFHKAISGAYGAYAPSPDRAGGAVMLEDSGKKRSGLNNLVVLHEGIHAATSLKLFYIENMEAAGRLDEVDEKLLDAYDDLVKLMAQANEAAADMMRNRTLPKEVAALAAKDAFVDVHEFVAYGLTDANMKAFLLTLPGIGTKKSGLSRFVSALLKLLQIGKNNASALRDLVIASGKLMEAKTPSAKAMAEAAALTPEEAKQQKKNIEDEEKAEAEAKRIEKEIAGTTDYSSLLNKVGSLMKVSRNMTALRGYLIANVRALDTKVLETLLPKVPRDTLFRMAERAGVPRVAELEKLFREAADFRFNMLEISEGIGNKWIALPIKMQTAVAEVMHTSTVLRIDPSKDTSNVELNGMWNKLTPAAQQVYKQVRDYYNNNRKLVFALMAKNVNDSTMNANSKALMIDRLQTLFNDAKAIDPYFPLMRYGQYWAQYDKNKDLAFVMYDSALEKEEAIQKFLQDKKLKGDKRSEAELREEGELSDGNDIQTLRDKVADHNNLLKDILRKINETSTFSESVKDDLAAEVFQMHLMTLPEASFQKAFIRRKDRKGYSEDALRNFVTMSSRMAQQVANIKYGPRIRNTISSVAASIEGMPDRARLEMLISAIKKDYEDKIKPSEESGLGVAARVATRIGYLYYMTRLRHVISNLWAIPSRSIPIMHKYFAMGAKADAEVEKMFTLGLLNPVGITKKNPDGSITYTAPSLLSSSMVRNDPELSRPEFAHILRRMRRVASQETQTFNIMFRKNVASKSKGGKALEYANRYLGAANQGSERIVRELTIYKLYKLARKYPIRGASKPMSPEDAIEFAHSATTEALYDYSRENEPAWMKNAAVIIPANYKKWGMFTLALYGRNLHSMLSPLPYETRRGAALAVAGMTLMAVLGSGLRGAFLISQMLLAYGAMRWLLASLGIGGDKDEDEFLKDLNLPRWFTERYIPQMFGSSDWANILRSGVFNTATGADVASSISESSLIFNELPDETLFDNFADTLVSAYFGATGSLVSKVYKATQDFHVGDIKLALATGLPGVAGDVASAYRYTEDGARTRNLDVRKYREEFTKMELFMQVLGYKPADLAKLEDIDALIARKTREISTHREKLIRDFVKAMEIGNERVKDARLNDIHKFNEVYKHPDLRIEVEDVIDYRDGRINEKMKMLRGLKLDKKFYQLYPMREKSLADIERRK